METYEKAAQVYAVAMAECKKSQHKGATDPPLEPDRPTERRVLVSDITIERLGALHEENPLGLLLVRDELAAWAWSFDRYAAGGKGADQAAWLSLYDGSSLLIDRKTGKRNYFIDRASVSVLGSIQPGTLQRLFSVAEREAGLLARLLLVYPPERAALWSDAELPDSVAESWKALLTDLLNLPGGADESGEPRPHYLPLSADAKAAWVPWHNQHVAETLAIGDDDLAAHFAKLKGGCIRFALVLTAVEAVTGPRPVTSIGGESMRRAIVIVDWFKAQSRRAYALLAESAGRRASRELAEWVEAHGGSVSVRELTHGRRAFRGDSAVAREALDRLVKEGVGRWAQDAPTKKGGRPAERFELVTTVTVTETPRHDAPEGVMVTVTPVTPPENDNGPPVDEVLFDVGLKPAGAIEP